jgi:hypothetical protein
LDYVSLLDLTDAKEGISEKIPQPFVQCSGSGSKFLGLPDQDPLVTGKDPDPDPSILEQKQEEKLGFFSFLTSLTFYL